MTPYYKDDWVTIYNGDCLQVLKQLPDEFINCCVTSPPYWGLRDYGVEGQIGLENTPDEYVQKLVAVFREVRRVLRDDGTCWVNLGDSYAGSGGAGNQFGQLEKDGFNTYKQHGKPKDVGLKPKDLIGIPWMVAFALRSDGWYLRQDIIWHKPNPMPESVTDRCTKSHEYIFLLSKSKKYYYDHKEIMEEAIWDLDGTGTDARKERQQDGLKSNPTQGKNGIRKSKKRGYFHGKHGNIAFKTFVSLRNKRSVWTINTKPYKEAHFAVFPPKLIEPCILAGCPVNGTVLDPFAGSGTTLEVSKSSNRKSIGIELNEKYIELEIKRVQQEVFNFGETI